MPDRAPLELAFVGSGNAFAPERCWSGFVLNQQHLFDAPPTALYSLKRMGMPLTAIQTIFISHFHADHFFGLPFLLLEYAYLTPRSTDLTLVGPPGIEGRLTKLVELGYPSLLGKHHGYRLRFLEIDDGLEATVNGLRFRALEVDHAGPALRCFGFRVESDGRTLAYTGDSSYCPPLIDLARGADVLVTDCTYKHGLRNPEHMSFDEVRELQAQIGGTTDVILTHLGGDIDVSGTPRMIVAADQGRYRL